jgi:Fe-S oxidoreductase
MAAEAGKPKDAMRDEGLERGVAGLTKEKIRRVIDSETGARLQAYVDTCVHCGLWSEACHFFLSRDRDPRYSPVGKVKQTLWEMLRRDGNVSPDFIRMNVAGVNWTMPATPGWDNSDMAMFTGDNEIMGRIKRAHFETAARLRVKRIVMGECGHAFRSVYDVGNRWLGWSMPPIPIVHAIEFYHELLTQGRITIARKFEDTVTLHDPCNVSRGAGLHEKAREVVRMMCANFVEMEPNREHNYCCGAGGGVINCGPPYKKGRIESTRVKAEQISAAKVKGAKVVITPCHNCHSGIEDIIHHYDLGVETKFLGDILYEVMAKPD